MSYAKKPQGWPTQGEIVDEFYAAMEDPTVATCWNVPLLKLLVILCSGNYRREYFTDLLANALATLSIEDREWFMETYSVPGNVIDRMSPLPMWPEIPGRETFPMSSPDDLIAYKARMDRHLVEFAEQESSRVTKKGDRVSMAYTQKFSEATRWALLSEDDKGLVDTATEFPYLHEFAEVKEISMDDASGAILSKGHPWNIINAKIEGERERFQIALAAAPNHGAVKEAFDLHSANISGLVDLLIPG